jgi:Ca-activated chloride channel family protein
VQDLHPAVLPDLFEGDQLVLLGRYIGEEPLTFVLRGNYLGSRRRFPATFHFDKASTVNAFVPRLWASRRIASLIDEIRQMGAEMPPFAAELTITPKLKELVDEVVRLSTEFGVLTEYTAFLAKEGTDLTKKEDVLAAAARVLCSRAMQCRTGIASVSQSLNNLAQMDQKTVKYRNDFLDARLNAVEVSSVQQVNDRAFYKKGDRWIDSRIVDQSAPQPRLKTIHFGSDEFSELLRRLEREGRQGTISLKGDILMLVDGKPVLITSPSE